MIYFIICILLCFGVAAYLTFSEIKLKHDLKKIDKKTNEIIEKRKSKFFQN